MYYIVFGLLYTVSLLPLRVLFILSDFFAFILYYVIGYRKKVVMNNLALAFPEKTEAERKKIARQFYRHFTDNWIEALKMVSISEKAIMKRITYDFKAFYDVRDQGRCCHMLMGHLMNWEWGQAAVPVGTGFKCLVAYAPITSKIMDRLFLYMRQRFGCVLLPFNDMRRAMMPYRHTQFLLALVADQNPSNPLKSYWLNFMGVRSGFVQGPEKGARMGNIPAVFLSIRRTRRGHYHMKGILIENDPGSLPEGELTRRYVAILEDEIRENPSAYLWSHKRWKHEWKEEYRKLWIGPESKLPVDQLKS